MEKLRTFFTPIAKTLSDYNLMRTPEGHQGQDAGYHAGCPCAGCRVYRHYHPENLSKEDRISALEDRIAEMDRRGR